MSSVIASNVPSQVKPAELIKFFSFAGTVTDLRPLSESKYQVVYEDPKAVSTALVLNDAELDNKPIKVDEDLEITDGETGLSTQQGGIEKERQDDIKETLSNAYGQIRHKHSADIHQEDKPKYAVLSELLAHGYTLSDDVVKKAAELDKKNGLSENYQHFIKSLNENKEKCPVIRGEEKVGKAYENSDLKKYFDDVSDDISHSKGGIRVSQFYQKVANDVNEIREHAKKLAKERENSKA
ncbi:vip1 [Candida margitis]|uniref:vip1 n=1 Tax=Candida margitis TaxID=1775924 RepID=UPI002226529B|nr:vip1 [Candida margitis]KAI5967204.1 vip1 [Candida margitis]